MAERHHIPATDAESSHWVDNGCPEVAPSCYNCPLPICQYDEPLKVQRRKTVTGMVKHLYINKKFSSELIILILNIQASTVRNALFRKDSLEELEPYYSNEWLLKYAEIELGSKDVS